MSINLLDMLKDQVTGSLAKQAGEFLGESEENVASGLGGIFPALLGSVINKSSEPQGATGLMDMIGGLDLDMLGDIGGLFGGGASSVNGLLSSGGGIIESLLGDKVGGVVEMISKVSGLKSGSSSSLLSMAAPFLMGIIGKQIKGKGLSFLTDLLMGQKDHVKAALPAGMGGLLGFSDMAKNMTGALSGTAGAAAGATSSALNDISSSVKSTAGSISTGTENLAKDVSSSVSTAANTGMSWLKWALPLVLVGALAIWGINAGWFGSSVKEGVNDVSAQATELATDATTTVGDAANSTMGSVSDIAKSAFATIDEAAKAALDKITFTANSAGSQLMDYIKGGYKGEGKVTFNNLTFPTGSAIIDESSAIEVDNLASILKAYPNVKINVSGYTDNQGNSENNKALSEKRAESVKARLVAKGISETRIATAGYGAENPVASNDTEEGRAKNRRIEVAISK
ncbi:MAG: OmpA family protein [Saprospiraceae bacterium]|nr:OmpA family protein [Saprospiraceae bacterium]